MTVTTTTLCPRCQAPLADVTSGLDGTSALQPEAGAPAVPAPIVVCQSCGLPISTSYLTEYQQLLAWQASATERLTWLHEHMLAGDLPLEGLGAATPARSEAAGAVESVEGPPEGLGLATAAPRRHAGAGSLLLAVGAFLLVAAGIAFIAFTWDLLGPFGQIAVLLALGAGCLATSARLAATLHGTAVAIGVVGALLVSISALGARVLGPDIVGAFAALVVAVTILAALGAAGRWIRPRTAGVGEVAGGVGALLVVVLLASAPVDDAIALHTPWEWWAAVCLLVGAVMLLLLADLMRMRTWPWLSSVFLVAGTLTLAAWFTDLASRSSYRTAPEPPDWMLVLTFVAVVAVTTLATSLVLHRLTRHHDPVTAATLFLWAVALVTTWVVGVQPSAARGWLALALAGVAAAGLVPAFVGPRRPRLQMVARATGYLALAASVGLAIPPYVRAHFTFSELTPQTWVVQAWPAWRGALSGLVLAGVLFVTVALASRATSYLGLGREESKSPSQVQLVLPLVTTGAALATWLVAAQVDRVEVTTATGPLQLPKATPDAFVHQIALTLAIVSLSILATALWRRVPNWSVWIALPIGLAAIVMQLSTMTVEGPFAPELFAVSVAAPTLVASISWWWLRRPGPTPTWQTITPPFVLAVLPSTVAFVQDAGARWSSEDPGTAYQVRMVALIAVAVTAAVLGARQQWAGLFFPAVGLALLIVGVELLDLGRFLPQWVSFGLAGAALVAAGARWEWIRNRGRAGAAWLRGLH